MSETESTENAVLQLIASRAEKLQETLISLRSEWLPKPLPPYVAMAEYAEVLTVCKITNHSLVSIFTDVENCLLAGGAAADLVAVGFLEALLGRASAGRFDFASIVNLLGPKSLEFCAAWDQYTRCTTVADAQRRALNGGS